MSATVTHSEASKPGVDLAHSNYLKGVRETKPQRLKVLNMSKKSNKSSSSTFTRLLFSFPVFGGVWFYLFLKVCALGRWLKSILQCRSANTAWIFNRGGCRWNSDPGISVRWLKVYFAILLGDLLLLPLFFLFFCLGLHASLPFFSFFHFQTADSEKMIGRRPLGK